MMINDKNNKDETTKIDHDNKSHIEEKRRTYNLR